MKYAELSKFSDEELVHRELALEREYTGTRFRLYTNQLEDSSRLKKIRREIAQLRTAERERERAQGLAKDSLRDRFAASFKVTELAGGSDGAAEGGFLQGIVDKFGGNE